MAARPFAAGVDSPAAVAIPDLVLRPYRGPEDFGPLSAIVNAARRAVGEPMVSTPEQMASFYAHIVNFDLFRDLVIAETDGAAAAYSRVQWEDLTSGPRLYSGIVFVNPRSAPDVAYGVLAGWAERRCRAMAAETPTSRPRELGFSTLEPAPALRAVLEEAGYRPVRFGLTMVRPDLTEIPDHHLPVGLEVRPAGPRDLRVIFEAEARNFVDHWGSTVDMDSDASFAAFADEPLNDLDLWQVAWSGDRVVGIVRPFINPAETTGAERPLGWCEHISVAADWRGRGVAKALISRALRALRDRGMAAAALGVDADNETGAVGLYRTMGFEAVTREIDWRQPLLNGARP